jgi:signal peptidase II
MKMIYRMCIMISAIIIGDQLTKALVQQRLYLGESVPVIHNLFHFTYVRNPGAAFGMFGYSADWIRVPLFFGVPVIACVWLLYLIWTTRNSKKLQCLAYSLIFAGAVGNLIDRFSMNYVVDFLDFFWGVHHFPAFNIADSSITIAAILLIYETLIVPNLEKGDSVTHTI